MTLNIIVTYYRDLEMWVRGHSRSLKVVPFESLSMVFYSPTIVTTAVSLAISQIFSIKEWPDLEIWVWGRSWSFKIARFDRLCTTFYWFAIATIAPSCTIFELFDVNAIGSRQISYVFAFFYLPDCLHGCLRYHRPQYLTHSSVILVWHSRHCSKPV